MAVGSHWTQLPLEPKALDNTQPREKGLGKLVVAVADTLEIGVVDGQLA